MVWERGVWERGCSRIPSIAGKLAPTAGRARRGPGRGGRPPPGGPAAARTVQVVAAAPAGLLVNPRIGEKLDEFDPREVRRILVGKYEIRYEIQESTIRLVYSLV